MLIRKLKTKNKNRINRVLKKLIKAKCSQQL
jgi:hypothetical protein